MYLMRELVFLSSVDLRHWARGGRRFISGGVASMAQAFVKVGDFISNMNYSRVNLLVPTAMTSVVNQQQHGVIE